MFFPPAVTAPFSLKIDEILQYIMVWLNCIKLTMNLNY
jgi:hypothetical protein